MHKKKVFLLSAIILALIVSSLLIFVLFQDIIVNGYATFRAFIKNLFDWLAIFISSNRQLSVILLILIFVLRTLFIVLPCMPLMVLSGTLFGAWLGFIYIMISIFLSSSIAFFISKKLGKQRLKRLFGSRLDIIDQKIEKYGAKILFTIRLTMLFPLDIVNYAAGLTKIKYKDLLFGNLLGMAPECFCLCFLGENLVSPFSYKFIIATCLTLLLALAPHIYKKLCPDKAPDKS